MYWKNLFFISTAFWVSAFFLANCSSQPGSTTNSGSPVISLHKLADCPPGSESKECQIIINEIEAYHALLDSLSGLFGTPVMPDLPVNDTMLNMLELAQEMLTLKGYQFKTQELREILAYADSIGQEDIYLMFAINAQENSIRHRGNSPIKYLDLYFQVKSETQGGQTFIPLDRYGDFPEPCPDSCP